MTAELCHRTDCHHAIGEHSLITGCLVEVAGSADRYCRCSKFVPAPEETGRTIPARTTDPDTSHRAAKAITVKAGTQRTRLLQAFATLEDATDEEAMVAADGVSPSSEYAKRCSELREGGFIAPTGDERTGVSGQARIVSAITPEGQMALAQVPGSSIPVPRRRPSRITGEDRNLVDRLRHLAANPNGTTSIDGATKVVLLQQTTRDLVDLLDRLA